mmetsp:Transcript_14419/g.43139  ORF Transcript_14419/g.43139 Transcript_14419/m.43139 type:complete len:219 (-) Transcript_14419:402-1058(-)
MRWQGPIIATWPPAFRMRSSSPGSSGLWSSESSTALPFLQTIARESPQFATVTRRGREGSAPSPRSMSAIMAVLPTRLKALLLSASGDPSWPLMRLIAGLDSAETPLELPLRRSVASIVSSAPRRDSPRRAYGKTSLLTSSGAFALAVFGLFALAGVSPPSSLFVSLKLSQSSVSFAESQSSSSASLAQVESTLGNSAEAMAETCAPPWPSKTAKRAW